MTFRFLALSPLLVCGAATQVQAQSVAAFAPRAAQAPLSTLTGALPGNLSGGSQNNDTLPSLTAARHPGSQITQGPGLSMQEVLPTARRVLVLATPAEEANRDIAARIPQKSPSLGLAQPAVTTMNSPGPHLLTANKLKVPPTTSVAVKTPPALAAVALSPTTETPPATRFELGHWVKPINVNLLLPAARTEAASAETPAKSPAPAASDTAVLDQLDSDLSLAAHNLDRAETRLSEGQKQLSGFTNVLQQAMLEAGADARGLNPFVRVAERYLGTPYVWGGVSGRGFDCSGFIIRVMHDLGYRSLPHSAAEQFRYGMPVANALLKPGDLVFFANTYKPGISHVGIFLGHRRFIHAANSNVGTIVSSIDEPKWVQKYAGARRLLPGGR